MRIANPIYDAVIKFLLEDDEIAKYILSTLLGENIVAVEVKPQEMTCKTPKGLKLIRLDFKALVKTKANKFKKVLLEMQKYQSGFQLKRFRSYLGTNYNEAENVPIGNKGNVKKGSLPIVTIYMLGFTIAGIDTPILYINRVYKDGVTGKILAKSHKYIENLTHDSLIIQIPLLKMEISTAIEEALDVFNQTKYQAEDKRFLEYTGPMDNPNVKRVVNRLKLAAETEEVLKALLLENELEQEYLEYEEKRQKDKKARKKAQRKEKEAQRKEKEAQQRAKEAQQKEKEAQQKEKEAQQKEKEAQQRAKEAEIKAETERKAKEEAEIKAETERKAKEEALLEIENLKKQLAKALKNKKN